MSFSYESFTRKTIHIGVVLVFLVAQLGLVSIAADSSSNSSLAGKTIDIGVVLNPSYQLLDAAAPVDYLNSHSKAQLTEDGAPADLIARAPEMRWYFIAESANEPVNASSGPAQFPTHSFNNPPPHLDYLLVPGIDFTVPISSACSDFIKSYVPKIQALLTVCTGSLNIAPTGVLDGHNVCSNKVALSRLAKENQLPKGINWVGDRRWIVDGKIWSAGGITAGLDLAAEFARRHFDPEIVEFVKEVAEETPKPDVPDAWAWLTEGLGLTANNTAV